MRVVVTGGDGFIGSHVMSKLTQDGHEAFSFDKRNTKDVRVAADVDRAFRDWNPDAVIHLAGVLGTDELFDKIETAIDINVRGTANILKAARDHNTRYVGITMPQVWDNIYQATKSCGERMASAFWRHYGLPVAHVRAFNAFGPGQKVYGVQKIIPTFATKAWANEPIPIWGDGTQTVDLVAARDIANMLIHSMQFKRNEIFDAGTGVAWTVNDVANLVIEHTGSTGGIKYLPMRRGEHETKIVATGEGWDKMGWHPHMDLEHLKETVDYYRVKRP